MAPSPWVTKVCNKMKREKWGRLTKKVTGQNTRKYDMEINAQAKSLFFTKKSSFFKNALQSLFDSKTFLRSKTFYFSSIILWVNNYKILRFRSVFYSYPIGVYS